MNMFYKLTSKHITAVDIVEVVVFSNMFMVGGFMLWLGSGVSVGVTITSFLVPLVVIGLFFLLDVVPRWVIHFVTDGEVDIGMKYCSKYLLPSECRLSYVMGNSWPHREKIPIWALFFVMYTLLFGIGVVMFIPLTMLTIFVVSGIMYLTLVFARRIYSNHKLTKESTNKGSSHPKGGSSTTTVAK